MTDPLSTRPKAAATIGNRPRRLWRRHCAARAVRHGPRPEVVAPPRELTFLDQAQRRLAELGLDADVLSALLDLEGLQRKAWRLSESTPGSAATRAWALARTVQLAKAERTGRN